MNIKSLSIIYLSIITLSFFIYTIILFLHFKILIVPLVFLGIGVSLKYFFKEQYLLIFTFLFPIVSGFAIFENKGFPFNYLMLPLFVLMGIFLVDVLVQKRKILEHLKDIHPSYVLFLFFTLISFVFLLLRWSNLTLEGMGVLQDTQVSPEGDRFSFGIFFPILNFFVFSGSSLYFLYLRKEAKKEKLVFAFLFGQCISVILSLCQNFFHLKWFSYSHYNGMSSDSPSFGFLTSIALLLSGYLAKEKKYRWFSIMIIIICLLGIINSHSKTSMIAFGFLVIWGLLYLKTPFKILGCILMVFLCCDFLYFIYNKDLSKRSNIAQELRGALETLPELFFLPDTGRRNLKSIIASRDLTWGYSLDIAKKYPLSGASAGNFVFWVKYDQYGRFYRHDHPNNQYLYVLSALGFIGLFVFLIFLWWLFRHQEKSFRILLACIFIILIFGNYFWVPESLLAFWLLASVRIESTQQMQVKKGFVIVSGLLILLFSMSEIIHFKALHPKNWARETGTPYNYGFWYDEKSKNGETFRWSKREAGEYLYLNDRGKSSPIKVVCGAPLTQFPDKMQIMDIYWKGKHYKQLIFKGNREEIFHITGDPNAEGFLDIRVTPVFNLKRMGLGVEPRTLGVQVYFQKR